MQTEPPSFYLISKTIWLGLTGVGEGIAMLMQFFFSVTGIVLPLFIFKIVMTAVTMLAIYKFHTSLSKWYIFLLTFVMISSLVGIVNPFPE